MDSSWINDRFKRYQANVARQRAQATFRSNALNAYNSKFDALKTQVNADVDTYNMFFGQHAEHQHCRAGFETTNDGFRVDVGPNAVRVMRVPGGTTTIIDVRYVGSTDFNRNEHIEVTPDEQGNLLYRFNDNKQLLTAQEASRVLLEQIFCGGV